MTNYEVQTWRHIWKSDGLEPADCAGVTRKRQYEKMAMTSIMAEMENCFLASSFDSVLIETEKVTVKVFENDTAFPTDGFDVDFNV